LILHELFARFNFTISEWGAEINARVARLYGLTEAEVAAIEGTRLHGADADIARVSV
jgi:hypothetical protein